ncbi:MAG TPA: DUF2062 domain-containing protein [Sphingomonadales bacterium]|nr:DUF2062 domain-containing protein [Sphingomonadales bacterium]
MFKRKKPREWHENVRESVWPSSGFRRTAQYYGYRITRIPGSSHAIAAGLATGVAVSFTPLFGLHLLLSFAIAWVIRGSLLAAAIGTLVGNPWTFPFILVVTYQTGLGLLGREETAPIAEVLRNFGLFDDPFGTLAPVLLPLVLGSLPFVVVSWIVVYFPTRKIIRARKRKIEERAALRAARALHEAGE